MPEKKQKTTIFDLLSYVVVFWIVYQVGKQIYDFTKPHDPELETIHPELTKPLKSYTGPLPALGF